MKQPLHPAKLWYHGGHTGDVRDARHGPWRPWSRDQKPLDRNYDVDGGGLIHPCPPRAPVPGTRFVMGMIVTNDFVGVFQAGNHLGIELGQVVLAVDMREGIVESNGYEVFVPVIRGRGV